MIEWFGTETGRKIFAKFGLKETLYHFCEECSELYAEICHYDIRSDRDSDNAKAQEEIADVLILLDDLWLYIGDDVELLYKNFISYREGEKDPKQYTKELLYYLARCIYLVTVELEFYDDTEQDNDDDVLDSDTHESIAEMIYFLEQYKKAHETGFDEVFKLKLQKRALRLNVSVQA